MRIHHLCLTCTCPDHLQTWITQRLQAADGAHLPTTEAYQDYLTWWFTQGQPQPGISSSNLLTRRLRLQGIPIARLGAPGNAIIGYRLAS